MRRITVRSASEWCLVNSFAVTKPLVSREIHIHQLTFRILYNIFHLFFSFLYYHPANMSLLFALYNHPANMSPFLPYIIIPPIYVILLFSCYIHKTFRHSDLEVLINYPLTGLRSLLYTPEKMGLARARQDNTP